VIVEFVGAENKKSNGQKEKFWIMR